MSIGCFQEPIAVVKIPKEPPAYVVPDHWTPSPSHLPMHSASLSFAIADEHGHTGEVSVLPMRPFQVEDVEIVNLWRHQLGLELITSEQAAQDATEVKIGPFNGKLFDLGSPNHNGDSVHASRMLTAYLHQTNRTWFFKLAGPAHLVETEKASFLHFLESVNFHKIQQDIQRLAPHETASPALQTADPRSRETPRWNAPKNWQSAPTTSSLQLARFHISHSQEGDAELTVSVLSGDGGGLLPNVNRWRRQIDLPPLESELLGDVIQPLKNFGGEKKCVLVDMTGGQSRVLVAVVSGGEETWFYKMTGAPGAIEKEITAFTNFVRSVQYPSDD